MENIIITRISNTKPLIKTMSFEFNIHIECNYFNVKNITCLEDVTLEGILTHVCATQLTATKASNNLKHAPFISTV